MRDPAKGHLPTLIILASPTAHAVGADGAGQPAASSEQALAWYDSLHSTVQKGLASGLPVMLVAPALTARQARQILPPDSVVEMPEGGPTTSPADCLAQAVSAGVQASGQASGWLILPADMPMLQVGTLQAIAGATSHQPVVFPQYRQTRGNPIGFSAEFYSELVRLNGERDLRRLIARYPAFGVDVDDPGVLMGEDTRFGLAQLRVNLRGSPLMMQGWR